MSEYRLLVLDDEAAVCDLIRSVGEQTGYEVVTTNTSEEFKDSFAKFTPTFIMLDLRLGETDVDGIEVLRNLAAQQCNCPIVIVSNYDEKILSTAIRLGKSQGLRMLNSLSKPIEKKEISSVLEQAKLNVTIPTAEQLVRALEDEHFVLHYQPKVYMKTGKIAALEALIRWQSPNQPLILPDMFIPLAEQKNLINPLTRWIMKEAFKQAAIWQSKGINLGISINLSAKALDDLYLPDEMAQKAREWNLNPEVITLEITETTVMSQPTIAMDVLSRLRLKGFSLSLDDFGTSYSSLVELYHMPFNEMEIDKSFVMNLGEDKDAEIIVKAIIDLGHTFGLTLVAEGVETQAAWDLLLKMGCDIAQGYYISKPMNVEEIENIISKNDSQLIH
jgi:EAL domain-containing protein (putative c-di-GMP-specific phosphodiesterase class I)